MLQGSAKRRHRSNIIERERERERETCFEVVERRDKL
jgi:hypothetical protein